MTKISNCIWCLKESTDKDIEHIFPEALGYPPHLTLPGTVVCRKCNNDLAFLDRAISDDFDFLTVMWNTKRKRGRPAEVLSRGNTYAISTENGPKIYFNLDPVERLTPEGKRLAPFNGKSRDVRPSITKTGGKSTVEFSINFGQSPKFTRSLFKIALNSLAFNFGASCVVAPEFDWVRKYVKYGGTRRHVILTKSNNEGLALAAIPFQSDINSPFAVEIQIAFASFLLDLSEYESLLPIFASKAKKLFGADEYSIMPAFRNHQI